MADYVYLQGSESVENAGRNISGAAETIQRAANLMFESGINFERYVERFEMAVSRLEELQKTESDHLLEKVTHDKNCYKEVLIGAEFENISELPSKGMQFCHAVGKRAKERVREIIAQRDKAYKNESRCV